MTIRELKLSEPATCQICGGSFLLTRAVYGPLVLAHHGYQRPGNGTQTSSCPGSRELPYEISKETIQEEILRARARSLELQEELQEWKSSPPDFIMEYPRHAGAGRDSRKIFPPIRHEKPEDFLTTDHLNEIAPSSSYRGQFRREVYQLSSRIDSLQSYLGYLHSRETSWTPPSEELLASAESPVPKVSAEDLGL